MLTCAFALLYWDTVGSSMGEPSASQPISHFEYAQDVLTHPIVQQGNPGGSICKRYLVTR